MHQSQTFQSFKAHPLMLAMAILLPSFASAETSTSSSTVALPTISLKAQDDQSSVTEGTQSYTAKSANTATKLSLSLRETPQSVKVLTREYLDDANISSFQDLLNNVTGLSVNQWDERQCPFGERILHLRRHLRIDLALDKPILFQFAQLVGQHPRRHVH